MKWLGEVCVSSQVPMWCSQGLLNKRLRHSRRPTLPGWALLPHYLICTHDLGLLSSLHVTHASFLGNLSLCGCTLQTQSTKMNLQVRMQTLWLPVAEICQTVCCSAPVAAGCEVTHTWPCSANLRAAATPVKPQTETHKFANDARVCAPGQHISLIRWKHVWYFKRNAGSEGERGEWRGGTLTYSQPEQPASCV